MQFWMARVTGGQNLNVCFVGGTSRHLQHTLGVKCEDRADEDDLVFPRVTRTAQGHSLRMEDGTVESLTFSRSWWWGVTTPGPGGLFSCASWSPSSIGQSSSSPDCRDKHPPQISKINQFSFSSMCTFLLFYNLLSTAAPQGWLFKISTHSAGILVGLL